MTNPSNTNTCSNFIEDEDAGDFEDELESDEKEDFDENPKKKMKLSTNNVKCAKNDKKKK